MDIEVSAKALRDFLTEKGFKITTVGIAGDKIIVYAPKVREIIRYLRDGCLDQWQTFSVEVKRMGTPRAG